LSQYQRQRQYRKQQSTAEKTKESRKSSCGIHYILESLFS